MLYTGYGGVRDHLTTEALVFQTDYCGVKSGRDEDKFLSAGLTKEPARKSAVRCCGVPVNIECRVREVRDLGSHTMFLAEVLAVHALRDYMDEKGEI
jgi:flavin reductase (DIM6/NTAB) family NADH-FMN oxidoreductase RutF